MNANDKNKQASNSVYLGVHRDVLYVAMQVEMLQDDRFLVLQQQLARLAGHEKLHLHSSLPKHHALMLANAESRTNRIRIKMRTDRP